MRFRGEMVPLYGTCLIYAHPRRSRGYRLLGGPTPEIRPEIETIPRNDQPAILAGSIRGGRATCPCQKEKEMKKIAATIALTVVMVGATGVAQARTTVVVTPTAPAVAPCPYVFVYSSPLQSIADGLRGILRVIIGEYDFRRGPGSA